MIGDYVGWGPGAKILTSTHTGRPRDIPIIKSDLTIRPVRIEAWADVGTGAMVMPGVTVGRGSIVGAGAVVTKDVPPFAVVAGVPARFVRWREDEPDKDATHPAESSESRDSGLAPAMSVENRALNGR
jgi:acetyltransferase-like isoleucine patch superfamily enzyme